MATDMVMAANAQKATPIDKPRKEHHNQKRCIGIGRYTFFDFINYDSIHIEHIPNSSLTIPGNQNI